MNPLAQLQPLIAPAPVSAWPPAPGWWILLLLLPLAGWGLWRLRHWRPRKAPLPRAEQPLEPVRIAALAELAGLDRAAQPQHLGGGLGEVDIHRVGLLDQRQLLLEQIRDSFNRIVQSRI
jgi:hypothetical protein